MLLLLTLLHSAFAISDGCETSDDLVDDLLTLEESLPSAEADLDGASSLDAPASEGADDPLNGWERSINNAMAFLVDKRNPHSAKYEAKSVAGDVRAAMEEGALGAEEGEEMLEELGFLWSLSDQLEDVWELLIAGHHSEAKDASHRLADRIRLTAEGGALETEEMAPLLVELGRIWGLADGLDSAEVALEKGERAEAKALAEQVAEDARRYDAQGLLAGLELDKVESAAGAIWNRADKGGASLDVPYYYQFSNRLSPKASCQNTSVAMLLSYYGVDIAPDEITAEWGKDYAQSPEGLANVFNHYAAQAGISERLRAHRDGDFDDVRAQLDEGDPVIVHGYFTDYGHVVTTTGYDDSGYFVNDPAGRWNGNFKGGYPYGFNDAAGKGIHYSEAAYEDAVGTLNGYTPEPLWYHEVYRTR